MFSQQHFTKLKTTLCFAITALCFAATPASALSETNNKTAINPAYYEYPYQDIYANLTPDNHPYPEGFPYHIGLLYNTSIDMESSMHEQDLFITAVRLYNEDQLIQELKTQTQGLYIPEFEDFNFDGFTDIAIPLSSSGTNTFPYQYWLYNPQTQRFEDAPPSLNNIPAPEVDPQHQRIYAYHLTSQAVQTINIYRWENNGVVLQESLHSYHIPIKFEQDILYCYNEPYYDQKTGNALDSIRLTQSAQGNLSLEFSDWNEDLQSYTQHSEASFIHRANQFCRTILIDATTPYIRLWQAKQNASISTQELGTQIIQPVVYTHDNTVQECFTPYYDMQEQQIQWQNNCHAPFSQQPSLII